MVPQFRIVFNRRKTATRTKTGAVEIEVTYRGNRKRMSTGVHVYINQWDERRQKVCSREDSDDMNRRISLLTSQVSDAILSLLSSKEEFTFSHLDALLNKTNTTTFIDFCEEQKRTRNDLTEGTLKHHTSWLNTFKTQGFIKYFSDLTLQNIKAYDNWLRDGTREQSTIWGHHKTLKVYIHDAMAHGLVDRDPYMGFKVSKGKTNNIRYLRENEVKKIRDLELEPMFDRIRDLFVVQCYTGLAYADLMQTDWTQAEERDGHYIIRDQRQKTKETYYILLLKPVVEILKKYDFKLPHISNQKYNDRLKSIQAIAGIKTTITTHVGRHTFAVMMINHKVPIDIVAKMMGHSTSKTTEVYAEILAESVQDAYLSIDKLIK